MTWRSRLQLKSPGWSWAEAFSSRDGTLWLLLSQGVPLAWDSYSEMQVGKAAACRDTSVCIFTETAFKVVSGRGKNVLQLGVSFKKCG